VRCDTARMAGQETHGERAAVGAAVRWGVSLALAAAAGGLAARLIGSPSPAGAQSAADALPGGIVAVAGQITKDTYGLYLVDLRRGTVCMYQYLSRSRTFRLVAARTFVYDLQLDSYNTEPLPKEIQKMVADARRLKDVKIKP